MELVFCELSVYHIIIKKIAELSFFHKEIGDCERTGCYSDTSVSGDRGWIGRGVSKAVVCDFIYIAMLIRYSLQCLLAIIKQNANFFTMCSISNIIHLLD